MIGAGRTETAHMLFGLDTFETGQLLLEGKSVRFKSTHDALAAGVALVPENRKEQEQTRSAVRWAVPWEAVLAAG